MNLTEWEVIDYWDNRSVVMASNGQAAAEMVAGEPVSSVDARADGWTQYSTPYGFKAVKTKPVSTPAPAVVAGGDEALRAVRGVIQCPDVCRVDTLGPPAHIPDFRVHKSVSHPFNTLCG